jgi:hypothetical protein
MKSHKIVSCPTCGRKEELFFLRDIRVYYGGCLLCHNNIFALDDDVAWVKEYSEKFTHHWWIFRLTRRYWGTGLPKVPFTMHQVIREPNMIVSLKLTDKILTLYKKMYQGYQVPLDIDQILSEKDDED